MTKQDKLPPPSDDKTGQFLNRREIWPDILRIIATFAVIILHSAASGFYNRFPASSTQFQACNFYNSIVRFAVPIFVMISGVFLLDSHKDYSLKKLYFVKIFRLGAAFVIWSTFYSFVGQYHAHHTIEFRGFVSGIIYGHYHLWFLFMISGLYIATPILRWIAENEKICAYFIIVSFCCVFLCNAIGKVPKIGGVIAYTIGRLDIKVVAGFSGYFLLGHWLINHKLRAVQRKCIYALGVFSILCTIVFNGWYSAYRGIPKGWVFNNLFPNTLFSALGLFVFCQNYFSGKNFTARQYKLISLTAKLSFGIYLVHAFFLEHLHLIGLPHFFIHPFFSIPITACLTFTLSFCTIYIISKIPVLKKYAM